MVEIGQFRTWARFHKAMLERALVDEQEHWAERRILALASAADLLVQMSGAAGSSTRYIATSMEVFARRRGEEEPAPGSWVMTACVSGRELLVMAEEPVCPFPLGQVSMPVAALKQRVQAARVVLWVDVQAEVSIQRDARAEATRALAAMLQSTPVERGQLLAIGVVHAEMSVQMAEAMTVLPRMVSD